jgi:hypothetical protein
MGMASELGRQRDATAAGNELVPLALGLLQFLDRVAAAVSASPPAPAAPPSPRDEQILNALLGLLSLRRALRRWLVTAALVSEPSDRRPAAPRSPEGSWLR